MNSLDNPTIEVLSVAEWYKESPDIVSNWSMRKFSDRQEFMFVRMEQSSGPAPEPVTTEYQGPKNRSK